MIRPWVAAIYLKDIFHNPEIELKDLVPQIVERFDSIKRHHDSDLIDLLEELGDQETPGDFDLVWDAIYDWCDVNRIWVETV